VNHSWLLIFYWIHVKLLIAYYFVIQVKKLFYIKMSKRNECKYKKWFHGWCDYQINCVHTLITTSIIPSTFPQQVGVFMISWLMHTLLMTSIGLNTLQPALMTFITWWTYQTRNLFLQCFRYRSGFMSLRIIYETDEVPGSADNSTTYDNTTRHSTLNAQPKNTWMWRGVVLKGQTAIVAFKCYVCSMWYRSRVLLKLPEFRHGDRRLEQISNLELYGVRPIF